MRRLSAAGRRPVPAYGAGARVLVEGSHVSITAVYADPGSAEAEYGLGADNGLFGGRVLEFEGTRPEG